MPFYRIDATKEFGYGLGMSVNWQEKKPKVGHRKKTNPELVDTIKKRRNHI